MKEKNIELAHGLCVHATLTQKLLYKGAIRTDEKNCDVSCSVVQVQELGLSVNSPADIASMVSIDH